MLRPLALLAVLGGLSATPPYLGPLIGLELGEISATVELVDHLVPGIVVLLSAGLTFLLMRAGRVDRESLLPAIAVSVCLLAGVWETSSHVPLVLEGGAPEAPWDAVVLHSFLGPVLAGISLWLVLRTLAVEPGVDERSAR